ncbi:aspartate/glutamate racemase family protein [Martelella sp. HB161492]|uniref:aspartate/glutamate racemase family protein n=1 Tax=Martelella sp. HB161492 TaxID=2720726 RepID=UPI00158FCB11|nr:aspartate/glutamate racemase family protein [Martelella sp. HB161492]
MERAQPDRRAIGVILPSSNRIVERVTHQVLRDHPEIDACFTRVPYAGAADGGYDHDVLLAAAALLGEARVDVIVWNATRGAFLGFDHDRRLCAAIRRRTGTDCLTAALSTADYLRRRGLTRIGLVAQGKAEEVTRLTATFAAEKITIAAGSHLGVTENFDAALVSLEALERQAVRLAEKGGLDAILIWSTNLPGHVVTARLSASLAMPVLDPTEIAIMHALDQLNAEK